MSHDQPIAERLDRLERELAASRRSVRRLHAGVALLGGALAVLLLSGAGQPEEGNVIEHLRVHRLSVLDAQDKPRMETSVDAAGKVRTHWLGADGTPRILIAAPAEGDAIVSISDPDGTGIFLATTKDEAQVMLATNKKRRVVLGARGAGNNGLQMWDATGAMRLNAGMGEDGESHFILFDPRGPRIGMSQDDTNRSALAIFDADHKQRIILGTKPDGSASINLFDAEKLRMRAMTKDGELQLPSTDLKDEAQDAAPDRK